LDKLLGKRWKSIKLILCPAIMNGHGLTFDESSSAETPTERGQEI
jgi:hypothetical protein